MHRRRQFGYTLTELVIVLTMIGIMAAVALPRMTAALGEADAAWHDDLVGALRHAQRLAVAKRRLVCVTVTSTSISLTSDGKYQARTCLQTELGPDGKATYASTTSGDSNWAGMLYCQPDGRITSDVNGSTAVSVQLAVKGAPTIQVYGETGYVE